MKRLLMIFAVPVALLCGAQKPAAKQPVKQTAGAPTIPADAKEVEPFLYSATDAQGKKWLYRQTPFGVVKMEDKPAAAPAVDHSAPLSAADLGDSVKFVRNTPFGPQTWTRKKSELNDEEKAALGQTNAPASQPGASSAAKAAEKQ